MSVGLECISFQKTSENNQSTKPCILLWQLVLDLSIPIYSNESLAALKKKVRHRRLLV